MSVRALCRICKYGKTLLRNIHKRELNTSNICDKINVPSKLTAAPNQVSTTNTSLTLRKFDLRNVGLQIGLQARRILIDNVLNRVTNSLSGELRKKAARRILYGDSGPFFALVGVSLASGTGILTKEEELEGVCWEIRQAISKIQWDYHDVNIDENRLKDEPITLKDLSLGKPIAKGANAVVYAANLRSPTDDRPGAEAEAVITSEHHPQRTEDETLESPRHLENNDDHTRYPLALKMMFNYSIQSSSLAILKAMYKETVPARVYYSNTGASALDLQFSNKRSHLPPHPNIVAMFSVFTDYIPELENCRSLYPAALPRRIYEEGDGRNMSLFLLMKRYHASLQEYLASSSPNIRASILLLTQLLEGVAHLVANGIAHRDLKSDNLLIDISEPEKPNLVISDFGCCLDSSNNLMLKYTNYDVDKGGNAALMAPEIITQQPGLFSVLNYTKSDLWAAATIAYEIFGQPNPFWGGKGQQTLRNVTYKEEDLPELPEDVPLVFRALVGNLLQRNPNQRLDPEIAANVCQLYLWAPSYWLKRKLVKLPSSAEILQWLLSLTTKVLCEGRLARCDKETNSETAANMHLPENRERPENFCRAGRRTYPEYLLISSFLCRAKISNIRAALTFIQDSIPDSDNWYL